MRHLNRKSRNTPHRLLRRGSAPLELVLSLPIMLFVMALILDYGTMASWKVRAAAVAREAAWRTHWPHQGGGNPTPASWPIPPAGGSYPANTPFSQVSLGTGNAQTDVLAADPFSPFSVVRGPTVLPNSPMIVDDTLINFPAGLMQGTSHIKLRLPLLPGLPQVTFNLQHSLLDGQFQFGPMGYSSNESRRALLLFGVNPPNQGELNSLANAYEQAVTHVYQIWAHPNPTASTPTTPGVLTLDRDDEFQLYEGIKQNFHPTISGPNGTRPPCETDREQVRINHVIGPSGIVERIQGRLGGGKGGVPDDMAGVVILDPITHEEINGTGFIGLYLREIQKLKRLQPPPQSQIDALKQKVEQLKQFKQMLN